MFLDLFNQVLELLIELLFDHLFQLAALILYIERKLAFRYSGVRTDSNIKLKAAVTVCRLYFCFQIIKIKAYDIGIKNSPPPPFFIWGS